MKTAERRRILILFAARKLRLDGLDVPRLLGEFRLSQGFLSRAGQRADERHA